MFRSISLFLGIFSIIISLFSVLNILYSYYFEFYLNIKSYWACSFGSVIFGLLFIYLQKKDIQKINFFEKLFIVIIGFFYFPILISIPYFFSIYELSFIESYFESISGFTTTGFSIFNSPSNIDESLLIWRSSSQWLGGLYFLFSLFLLTDSSNLKIKLFFSNLEWLNLSEIKHQYLKILFIYSFLTLVIFFIFNFVNFRLFDSLNLSMTIISSGGFLPSNSLLDIIINNNQKFFFTLSMLIPLFNLYLFYNLFLKKFDINNFYEDIYLACFLIFIIFLSYIFLKDYYFFSNLFFSIVSSLSNIGFGMGDDFKGFTFFLLILTIIGGSSFSTTSGLKFIKLYVLFKFSLKEIYSLVRPLYVYNTNLFLSKYKFKDNQIKNYFLTFIFFICCFFFLSWVLSFNNISFDKSLTISILTLTNTVNSNNFALANFDFYQLSSLSKFFLILFMIIGRVELLGFLILLKRFFLKN